jgi:Uma2 family endonuclease
LGIKNKIYAEVGISEYWVVNLPTMELIVFREPTNEGYQSRETLTQGNINSLAFPDVAVSVARILGA